MTERLNYAFKVTSVMATTNERRKKKEKKQQHPPLSNSKAESTSRRNVRTFLVGQEQF